MGTVTSRDSTIIAFEKVGQGPAVILVNGAMSYRENFGQRPLATELSKALTVITYDRRGRGESTDTLPYEVQREIEDIEALIEHVGTPIYLYGFSSGAVLALKAAARLGEKVARLALYGAPLELDEKAKQHFAQYTQRMNELLMANKRSDAVTYFLADMMPPEMIEEMRQSPQWPLMEAVAHTLAYDNAVMGDGVLADGDARATTQPTVVLDGSESPAFIQETADALAKAMPHAIRKTIPGQHVPSPEALAPVLLAFFLG